MTDSYIVLHQMQRAHRSLRHQEVTDHDDFTKAQQGNKWRSRSRVQLTDCSRPNSAVRTFFSGIKRRATGSQRR